VTSRKEPCSGNFYIDLKDIILNTLYQGPVVFGLVSFAPGVFWDILEHLN
jgi:hypothetical protein